MESKTSGDNLMKYIALGCAGLAVGIDQLIKYLVTVFLAADGLTFPIIKDVFHLTYIENRGAAFSILEGRQVFLVGLTSVIIILGIVAILSGKLKSKFLLFSIALIIGGGIGNLIDRFFKGYVIDYFDFRIINFAIFNFADCCVVIGTIMVMIYVLFLEQKSKKENELSDAN